MMIKQKNSLLQFHIKFNYRVMLPLEKWKYLPEIHKQINALLKNQQMAKT
jgi:hypothetical protein